MGNAYKRHYISTLKIFFDVLNRNMFLIARMFLATSRTLHIGFHYFISFFSFHTAILRYPGLIVKVFLPKKSFQELCLLTKIFQSLDKLICALHFRYYFFSFHTAIIRYPWLIVKGFLSRSMIGALAVKNIVVGHFVAGCRTLFAPGKIQGE